MPTRFKSEDREKESRQGMRLRQTGNFSGRRYTIQLSVTGNFKWI